MNGPQRSQNLDTSYSPHWFSIQPSRKLIWLWGQHLPLNKQKNPLTFNLSEKLIFQPCHRRQGDFMLFYDLDNQICVPDILVIVREKELYSIRWWGLKKTHCQLIHWENHWIIGLGLHIPRCAPIHFLLIFIDLWQKYQKSSLQSRCFTWYKI